MKFAALAALASAVASANAYAITGDTVNCRSGPGTNYAVKKTYAKGHDVTLSCQTSGTTVNGNSIWDKTSDGCYVSDYYVKTGSNSYVTKKCSDTTTCAAPKSNQATVNLIAEYEGFVDHVYTDATGHPTVGYGHLCSNSKCSDVPYHIPLSQADGKKLLADDMKKYEKCITAMLTSKAVVNLNQYGALVSWAFNMGCGAAESSTLVKRLNAGENVNTVLSQELPKWVHGDGKVLPGLVRRRNAEIALAKTPTSDKALPVKC
ncbi:glycoside hydrolase family 24 protein [Thermothielavioides terrestris NRRL 8126]|uniref:Glycoside hydrolase family 24 protein n=1 Tax=Thermothielavioides terrestris (strain ATCC 38088 / NRRL 8126) TaxID=578455 RepID=G2RG69_THETT|nr:glycoside hydrolase family 24 protein [Thermothielavioides terrestris NRRL 8126]AEO71812.1 glycoside hydrolase family 24 protein [Thermothielavioides terrestris NRRL 8126]